MAREDVAMGGSCGEWGGCLFGVGTRFTGKLRVLFKRCIKIEKGNSAAVADLQIPFSWVMLINGQLKYIYNNYTAI